MAAPVLAQHFTPCRAVDFAYDLLHSLHGQPDSPRIIDPACGEGAFLHRAVERGLTTSGRAFGIERDPALAQSALSAPGSPRAAVADALLGLRAPAGPGNFDLVVANPPYGTGSAGLREMPDDAARHVAQAYALWALRGPDQRRAERICAQRLRSYPAEVLFLELCIALARPGGHVAILLPEGIVANARYRSVREWLLSSLQVDAVIGLPRNTFRRTGAAAKTALLVLTKRQPAPDHAVLLGELLDWDRPGAEADLGLHFATRRRQSDPEHVRRLDPTYWHPGYDHLLAACRAPLAPLADFISELTYGPIVTGRKPTRTNRGISLVNQGQVRFCGVDLADAQRVPHESPWVAERAMLRPGDVVLPRSGEGSLGKHRVAVFLGQEPASVGSFVDLIRLRGLNPFYLAAFLKSRLGRAQVSRFANGVGVPNISFGEIRALMIPEVSRRRQQAIEQRYRRNVLPIHRKAVARHRRLHARPETLCAAGESDRDTPNADAACRSDPKLRELRKVGERRWQAIIRQLDAHVLDPGLEVEVPAL